MGKSDNHISFYFRKITQAAVQRMDQAREAKNGDRKPVGVVIPGGQSVVVRYGWRSEGEMERRFSMRCERKHRVRDES